MVGYDTEDKAYCMELTFNYGYDSYEAGTGLKEFGIYVPDVEASRTAAKTLGYADDAGVIVGPDAYRFRLFALPAGRKERFAYVLCRAKDVGRSVQFYKDFLGFGDAPKNAYPEIPFSPEKLAGVMYASESHPHKGEPVVQLFYQDGVTPSTRPWEGRHAFALDASEVNAMYQKFKAERPELIMHDAKGEPISLQEKLGTLFIFIAKDLDGYELCIVSRETMLPAVVEAVNTYDSKLLDWDERDARIAAIPVAGKEIEAAISQHPVVLFSKEWCPFCEAAKNSFAKIDATIFVKELEGPKPDKAPLVANPGAFQDYLAAKTNAGRSVPKCFIKGKFIGGGDDVKELEKTGKLLALCVEAGAAVKVDAAATDQRCFVNGHAVSKAQWEAHKVT